MDNINLQQLFELIVQRLGFETGKKIRTEIENVLQIENVDINRINELLNTIKRILDANPDTEEFDVAQNIITQITDLRKTVEQNQKAIKALQAQITDIKTKQQDSATKSDIEDLQKQLDELKKADGTASKEDIDNLQAQIDELKNTKADKDYVDQSFLSRTEIQNINIDSIVNVFVNCMDTGYENPNGTVNDCQQTENNTDDNQENTDTDADSDGGVL